MTSVDRHRTIRAAVIAVATMLVATVALALDPRTALAEFGRRAWRLEHGLPNETIRAFAQSPDGYIWMGTQEGLVRFDGIRFVTMGERESLIRGAWIYALTVDASGTLWIASASPGLIRYSNGVFDQIEELDRLGVHDVFALAQGRKGDLWLGTDRGLVRRDATGRLRSWSGRDGLPSARVTEVLFDRKGVLWVVTAGGLVKLENGIVTRVGAPPKRTIQSLYESSSGALWVGTNQGVFRLENGRTFVELPELRDVAEKFVASIVEDASGTMWFGTSGGLKRLAADGTASPLASAGLSSSFVRRIFVDREQNLWVSTMEGVAQLRDTAFRMYGAAHGLRESTVLSVAEDPRGAVWLGFYDGLARIVDGKAEYFTLEDGLPNLTIRTMVAAREGGVWVGTWGGGVCRVGSGRPRCLGIAEGSANDTIGALHEDAAGDLWIASGTTLSRLRNGRVETFDDAGLPRGAAISVIAPARNGGMWIGTLGEGAMLFKDGRVVRAALEEGRGKYTRQILEEADGSLWIATEERGLTLVRDGKFTDFPLPSFGDSRAVLSVVDDGAGSFWVTTVHRILRLERQNLVDFASGRAKTIEFVACDRADGMISSEFPRSAAASFRARDGSIWFNGSSGAARLDRSAFRRRRPIPPISIVESVTAGGRDLSGEPRPAIESRGVRVEIRYTAINFAEADQLHFRYMLAGYDRGWIDAGTARSAVYTNLPPGDYEFRVMAADSKGMWNPVGAATFGLVRKPTVTETNWFYAGCALLLIALTAAAFRFRMRALKRSEMLLAQRVDEQTEILRRQTESLTVLSTKQSTILSSAGDGIIGLDADGRVSFVNPSGARMLSWPVDDLLGRRLHAVIHASQTETDSPFETCAVCGTHADPPVRAVKDDLFRSRTGETIPVEFTSSTITTEEAGRRIGVVVTFRDISERHQLERMKRDFVSTVSHELRTPLTAMRGALGLLGAGLLGDLGPRAQHMLDIAVRNSDRLVRLVNDILDIERLESGRVELARVLTDGQKLLGQAAEIMQPMADRAGVALRIDAAPLLVDVDPDRVTQVITNLLSNAFKFSPPGGVVTLSSQLDGGCLLVRVSDQGRGIPKAKLGLIFERFEQVDASDAREKGGTGLGLAICRSIVHAHGGEIWAESVEGEGSTFFLRLPDASMQPASVA